MICCLRLFYDQTPLIAKEKGKSKKNKLEGKQKNDRKKDPGDVWSTFCDFHEITFTVIKEATVTIYRQDNKRMVRGGPPFIYIRWFI